MASLDVTIIVPIYNASDFLKDCLDSILGQTYKKWTCLLINDGSTDGSQKIIDYYCVKDKRFSGYIKKNEKSAALARRYGIERAKSEWILQVDADDAIAPNYLEALVDRQLETGADCVAGRRIGCSEGLFGELWCLPRRDFDMSMVISGRDYCLATLGGWNLGSGAGIWRKSLLLSVSPGPYMNSDEYEDRVLSLLMKKKAFADVNYYFRHNVGTSDSISVRMFDRTLVDMQLERFVYDNFPERMDKIIALAWQRLFNLIYLTADFRIHKNKFTKKEQVNVTEILKKSYRAINRKTSRQAAPVHSLMITHSFSVFSLLATLYVRYKRSHGGNFYYR